MRSLHLLLSSSLLFAIAACAADHPDATSALEVEPAVGSGASDTPSTIVESTTAVSEGELRVVEVASDGCTPTRATSEVALGPGGAALLGAPGMLASIGDKYVVESERGTGFVTFGSSTETPRAIAEGDDHLLAGTSDIGILSSGDSVQYTRLSLDGNALEAPVVVAKERAYNAAGVRSGDSAFVAWTTYDSVRAAAITNGAASAPIELETGTPKDSFAAALAPTDSGALVIWSDRRVADGQYRVYSAWTTPSGLSGLRHILFGGSAPRRVVAVSPTKTGFVGLFAWGEPARPMLVAFDKGGRPVGTGSLFGGAREPLGLAVQGDTVGVLARRDDGTLVFRSTGGWVCLAGANANFPGGALIADGDGFSVAHGDDEGTVSHVHLAIDGN